MKSLIRKLSVIITPLILTAIIVGLVGCSTNESVTPTTAATTGTPAQTAVLTIVNGTQTKAYTMSELKAMTVLSGWAGQMSSTGNITGPAQYKGIAITDLLKAVGGVTDQNAIRVSAKDGYTMTLSYKQLTEGNFTIIDSKTGKEVAAQNKPIVFIAYEESGKALDDTIGSLRLGIMTSDSQVTEGHWWVKWTQKIEVIKTEAPYTLKLQGAVSTDIDPASFESCAAIGCHGQKWTDDQGRVWEGVPLYYFVGKVDDANDKHEPAAFNATLADQGAYEVHILAADGTMLKLTSKEVTRNNNMIVSFRRDGAPLPTNQWPLRLVGSALDKSKQIGQITSIKLIFGAATTTTAPTTTAAPPVTTAAPADTGVVVLTVASGSSTKTYTMTQLKALNPLYGYGSTKNKAGIITGPGVYTGVALTDLLTAVGGITSSQSVKITASDGFTKTLTYKQATAGDFPVYDSTGASVTASQQPIVSIIYTANGIALDTGVGPLQTGIMTGNKEVTDASAWVKMTVKIEVVSP